ADGGGVARGDVDGELAGRVAAGGDGQLPAARGERGQRELALLEAALDGDVVGPGGAHAEGEQRAERLGVARVAAEAAGAAEDELDAGGAGVGGGGGAGVAGEARGDADAAGGEAAQREAAEGVGGRRGSLGVGGDAGAGERATVVVEDGALELQ